MLLNCQKNTSLIDFILHTEIVLGKLLQYFHRSGYPKFAMTLRLQLLVLDFTLSTSLARQSCPPTVEDARSLIRDTLDDFCQSYHIHWLAFGLI